MSIEKLTIGLVAVVIAVLLGIAVLNAENRADYPIERNDRDRIDEGQEIDFETARDWGYRTPSEAKKKKKVKPAATSKTREARKESAEAEESAARTTLVKRGETYSHIARRVYGKASLYPRLEKANPNKSARSLRAGDTIIVPPLEEKATSAPRNARTSRATTGASVEDSGRRKHRVRRGETFTAIAAKYYRDSGRWREIAEANPNVGGPRGLRPGQELIIP